MRQSRLMSLVEAVANVVVGYGVAVLVQIVAVPAVRARRSRSAQNLAIGLVFTVVSIVAELPAARMFEVIR